MSKKRNDIVLVVVLLLLSVAGLLLYKSIQPSGDFAVVLIDGKEVARFQLSQDTEYLIETAGGTNTLVISNGKADVKSASCPDGICVDHAPISKVGETIVCLPNGVVIAIRTDKAVTGGIDMVA